MSENDYMGSQAEENAKYLDSIEGKLSQLKNRLQELAAVTIDSEWLKDIIDFGTKAVKLVTSISKQFGGLKTAIAGIGAIFLQKKGFGLFNKNQDGSWDFNNLGKGIVGGIKRAFTKFTWGDELGKVFDGQALTDNLADYLKNVHPDALTPKFKNWWEPLSDTAKEAAKVGDALENVGIRTLNVGGAFKALGSVAVNVLSTLGTMALSMAASWAIGKIFSQAEHAINWKKYKLEEGQAAQERINETKDNFAEKQKYVDENKDRFLQLREGVSETGKNVSLSAEQYAEYLEINQQLAEYLPTLVSGFDSQGNAILNLSSNIDQASKSIEELLSQEQQLQSAQILKDLPDTMEASFLKMEDAFEVAENSKAAIEFFGGIKEWIEGGDLSKAGIDIANGHVEFAWTGGNQYEDQLQSQIQGALYQAYQQTYGYALDGITYGDGSYSVDWVNTDKSKAAELEQYFTQYLNERIDSTGTTIDAQMASQMASQNQDNKEANSIKKAEWQKDVQNLISGLSQYDDFAALQDTDLGLQVQDAIAKNLSGIDPMKLSGEVREILESEQGPAYVYENYAKPFIDAFNDPKNQVTLNKFIDLDTSDKTNEELRNDVNSMLQELFPDDEETQLRVKVAFDYTDETGHWNSTDARNSIFEYFGGTVTGQGDKGHRYAGYLSWDDAKKLTQEQQQTLIRGMQDEENPFPIRAAMHGYESLSKQIDEYQNSAKQAEGVGTLANIFAMEDFDVSPFEDKLSAINTALSSLRENGELAADEQLTLQKQIPDLTDFSLESISDKGLNVLDDYINKMREYAETADLGEEGTKQFEKYISNLAAQQASLTPSLDAALNAMREHIVTADSGTALFESQTIQYADYINKLKSEYGDELDMNVIAYMTMEDMFSGSADEVLQKYEDAKVYVDLELGENNLDKAIREQQKNRVSSLLSLEEQKRQNKTANNIALTPEDYGASIFLQEQAVKQAEKDLDIAAAEVEKYQAKYNSSEGLAKGWYQSKLTEASNDRTQKETELQQQRTELLNTQKEQSDAFANKWIEALTQESENFKQLDSQISEYEKAGKVVPEKLADQASSSQDRISALNKYLGIFFGSRYRNTGDEDYLTKSNDYSQAAITATETSQTYASKPFETTMKQYSNQLTDLQNSASAIQEDITMREGRGLIPTLNQYSKLLHNGEQQLQNLKDQNYELRQQQYEVSDNQERYREIGDQIRANESAIASMKSNMLGWSDAMKAYAETMGTNLASAIQQAISESMSETGLTSASMKQLQAQFEGLEGFDFSDLYYNTANGVKLDFDAASHYVETQYRQETSILNDQLSRQKSELQSLQTQYNSTTNAAEKLKLATQIDATKSGIDNLYNQLSQYQAQIAATQKQFTQFAEFQRAQETANAGDTYKTIQGYMETQQKAYDLGEVGTDEFKAFTAMGDEWGRVTVEAYEANQAKLKRYLTEDAVGIKNFYDDLVKAGFGTYDDENGYRLDISDYSEAAHALGIGEELMKYTMQRSEDFGFYNDYVESVIDGELKLQETEHDLADAIERKYDLMQKGAPKDVIDEANAEIERLDERTINLNDKLQDVVADASTITSSQIQTAVDVLGEYKKRLDSAKTDSEKYAWQKEITQFAEQHHIPLTFDYDVDTAKLDEMFAGWSERGHNLRLGIDSSSLTSAGYDSGKLAYTYSTDEQSIVMTPVLPDGSVMNVNTFSKYMSDVAMGARQNTEGLAMRVFEGENAQQEAKAYANVLNAVNAKMQENEGLAESLTSQLGQFTYEELSSIDYADGKLAEGHEQAEQAVDSVMRALGLSSEQAQQFIQLLQDMGVVQSEVADKSYNLSLNVETDQLERILSTSSAAGVTQFDAMSMSADQLAQKIKELENAELYIDTNEEGAEEALKQLEELKQATEKQYNIQLGLERMDADPNMSAEEFLGLDRIKQEQYLAHIGVDRENYDAAIQQIKSQNIQQKVDVIIDEKGLEELQSIEDDDELREILIEQGVDTSEVDEAMEYIRSLDGEEVPLTVKIDESQFDSLTSSISSQKQGNVIPFDVTVNTVQALQSIAVISAAITALRVVAFLPINITVNTETAVNNANALRDAINEIPKNTPVKVTARVYGLSDVYAVRNQINSVNSTSAKVTVSIGSSLYNIRSVANELNSLHDRVITVTTIKTTVNAASGSTGAAGTSNNRRNNTWKRMTMATGTLYGVAHASGTAYNTINTKSISAYAGGKRNVALPKDEDALVNELNPESIIFKKVTIISNNYQKIYLIAGKPLELYLPQRNHEIQINAMV